MRRHRRHRPAPTPRKTKPPVLGDALARISEMENAVCYRTVTRDFTVEEVAYWLWPRDVVDTCRKAHAYCGSGSTFVPWEGPLLARDTDFWPGEQQVWIWFNHASLNMMRPVSGLIDLQHHMGDKIVGAIAELHGIVQEFATLRRVVEWFDAHGTYRSARYYCHTICNALLPSEHPCNAETGYGEPNRSIAEIAADLRASHAILAKGLLSAPKDLVIPEMNSVSVRFEEMGREISVL